MPVNQALKEEMFKDVSDDGLLVLMTITHPSLGTPLRFVRDYKDVVSRGDTFLAFPFNIILPKDADNEQIKIKLQIDGVTGEIVEQIRVITTPPSILIEIVSISDPDTVQREWGNLTWRNTVYDVMSVSADLQYEDILNEPFPHLRFSINRFPGLF